jgi:membrane associated rhomboid family serine protease
MMRAGRRAAWLAVAAALAGAALSGGRIPQAAIDWQPARFAAEPWRAVTAVGVHYGAVHLAGNLVGVAMAAAFGVVARVSRPYAVAWLVAWPLTQIGLLARPALDHYGGLSGVLHAGVAVVVTGLLIDGTRGQRWVALAIAVGFGTKLASESPWGPVLQHPAGWTVTTAPIAHATGAAAGVMCATVAAMWQRRARRRAVLAGLVDATQ